MGSLLKSYNENKLKGKIYTPAWIVHKILDELLFCCEENIVNKTILDPACGDGRFLEEIVSRVIQYVPKNQVESALYNIYGWDIDDKAVSECIHKLDKLIEPLHLKIQWNVKVQNSIWTYPPDCSSSFPKFDYIVGNPPYIRIQHLDLEARTFIQKHYQFCQKGSTDIYLAFFELCFHLLKEQGRAALITPNTFLYTQSAEAFRKYIHSHKNLLKIINYRSQLLFEKAGTYSAITLFSKQIQNHLIYCEITENTHTPKLFTINYDEPSESVFERIKRLGMQTPSKFQKQGKKLKEICKIGVGITTLCDKAYIFNSLEPIGENHCKVNSRLLGKITIELDLIKPIIKGSTFKGDEGHPNEFILFPYYQVQGKYQIIPEDQLKEIYPLSYAYLLSVKDILQKRDNGKPNPVAWYAFGRNQSLDTAFGKKIIFAPMNKKPLFILSLLENCTLYSGYFIKYEGDYEALLAELNSDRMAQYIDRVSRDFRGGWKAYNKKAIEDFEVYV